MPKFMIIHNTSSKAKDVMATSTPEEQQKSMQEWIAWKEEADKKVKFDFGMPLQAAGRVMPDGSVAASDSPTSGYSMIEADSAEDVYEVLKTHPQLKLPDASMDVLEIIPMPGIGDS